MTAITLVQAQTHLAEALAALSAARRSIGYSTGDRSLQRPRLEALERDVALWERRVTELTAAGQGADNPGYVLPKFV